MKSNFWWIYVISGFFLITLFISFFSMFFLNGFKMMILEFQIFNFFTICPPLVFMLDFYSILFFFTVSTIASSVFFFSWSYMSQEIHFSRFHLILLLFVISMLTLIFMPGMISLFIGWDGLGLSSFLLVIYFSNSKSLSAGILTVLTNRLGDGLLLISIPLSNYLSSFNLSIMGLSKIEGPTYILLVFIVGAITKSAQLPFSAWLPAAMAAPTPVSSLVHSSTLVTAGVYILIRLSGGLGNFELFSLLVIGLLTKLMAAISARLETDMKKIVSLSTLSQLGIMVVAIGIKSPKLAFFHLIAHAFFKALLFIGVGSLMHATSSFQDLKVMGGFSSSMPLSSSALMCAKASLCGLPFFSGFFSKETILDSFMVFGSSGWFSIIIMCLGIVLTQLYTIRFIFKTMIYISNYNSCINCCDYDIWVEKAFKLLLLPAIFGGVIISSWFTESIQAFLSPKDMKFIIVMSVFVSLILIMKNMFFYFYLTKKYDKMFYMWLTPYFSGQLLGKIFSLNGDYQHKFIGSSFIDKTISLSLNSSMMFLSTFGTQNLSNIFRLTSAGGVLMILLYLYLCIP